MSACAADHSSVAVTSAVDGRSAVVVRIDPVSGTASEVLHVRDDSVCTVDVLAGDIVTWWEELTSWAEHKLAANTQELEPEATNGAELRMLLKESIEHDFADWLVKRP